MSFNVKKSPDDQTTGSNALFESSEGIEDQDESSNQIDGVEEVLSNFRETWQRELQVSPNHNKLLVSPNAGKANENSDYESEAKMFYLKGVEMEKSGKLYEAIKYYRKAVQLIPDIEFRLDNLYKPKPARERQISENNDDTNKEMEDNSNSEKSDDEEIKEGELLGRIQKKLNKSSSICIPKFQQTTAHISILPLEMILYILRWLVSSDLDLRSLEMCSMVSRGFYLCARDPEIWRLACLRVWGVNCGSSPNNHLSWRHMFIEKSRLHFNGCYIGKTTYIRHGENSFQDQFYRPWHLVAYYRYLRFFPEGIVLVLTSSEEPAQCVGQMKYRNARSPILKGYYRLKDDRVTLIVQTQDHKGVKSKRRDNLHDPAEHTFHMELQIKSTKKKKHFQLVWTHYSVFTRTLKGDESTCNFDIVASRFPPFWFSRVKSYTSESYSPLQ